MNRSPTSIINRNGSPGFSLIELAVVIAISALVIAISLPKFATAKIAAGRAEVYQNLRGLQTKVIAFYTENENYPLNTRIGMMSMSGQNGDTITDYCTPPNDLGHSVTNCEKLRYFYSFQRTGGCQWVGQGVPVQVCTPFSYFLNARSVHYIHSQGFSARAGAAAPTNMCKKPQGYLMYFMDSWIMDSNGNLQAGDLSGQPGQQFDALKNCF